ncbi:hypothetical protein [Amycolatopsis jejuensis]|uniref:hypothetical protein n=1 Tax=Amycolatopsis jejuensis TaxID=330084 RepID=UPI0012E030FD|nr:hypothetical protein [Amycolatopsis jejuensis]
MTDQERPPSGQGHAEGAETTPPEDARDTPQDPGYEIPIGMPVSPEEMDRLKKAAERHRAREEETENPTQNGDPAEEKEGDDS